MKIVIVWTRHVVLVILAHKRQRSHSMYVHGLAQRKSAIVTSIFIHFLCLLLWIHSVKLNEFLCNAFDFRLISFFKCRMASMSWIEEGDHKKFEHLLKLHCKNWCVVHLVKDIVNWATPLFGKGNKRERNEFVVTPFYIRHEHVIYFAVFTI